MRGEIKLKKWLFAMLIGLALVLAACGGDDSGDKDKGGDVEVSAGEEIYQNSCMACHGGNLDDGSAPDLTAIGSKLSADDIADIIENGTGSMPAQKGVSDDDRETLANWLADKK